MTKMFRQNEDLNAIFDVSEFMKIHDFAQFYQSKPSMPILGRDVNDLSPKYSSIDKISFEQFNVGVRNTHFGVEK